MIVTTRDVEPVLFASTNGRWYLVGWCRLRDAMRWFAVSRIEQATVTKAAAGAVEHLSFAVVGGLPTALQQLSKQGVWVVGLDGGGSTGLWDLPAADGPIVLVLGAEGAGLSRLVRQRCDAIASIPLAGSLGSLNVAAAAALACFEVTRARNAR